jgi:rhodanese-related sulfurtransferase
MQITRSLQSFSTGPATRLVSGTRAHLGEKSRVPDLRLGAPSRVTVARAAAQEEQQDEYTLKYPSWESIQPELVSKYDIESLSVEQAKELIDAGKAVLVDVRPQQSFEEEHPKGAINAPAFRVIDVSGQQGGGFQSMMRFAVMKFNGVTPTEANPEFPELMKKIDAPVVILMCKEGGSLTPTTTFPFGKVSRSLKACWRLLHNGVFEAPNVKHVEGGMRAWVQAGYEMEE